MLLLTGPARSGKTWHITTRFREALCRKDATVRLLVPTATMAQHLQNRFAREGFVFSPGLVQTLSRFLDAYAEDLPQVSEAAFYLIVEEAARSAARAEFARVIQLPGFCASLARTIAEFSSAGCDAERLAGHLPEAPLGAAFLAVYEETERELARRGLFLRARRLARVAERIAREGMPGISTVWLDGFHALPDPELAVIGAMGARAKLTLTLPSGAATRARLLAMGFREEKLPPRTFAAPVEVVEAASVEREADEIARRILAEAAAGRPFREMGIILRSAGVYEPLLRGTLERFGIPARFYFDAQLANHPVARYLAGAVDAMLGGWDHGDTLEAMRLAPNVGDMGAMDRFDFAVRERLPGRGLDALSALVQEDDAPVRRLLEAFRRIEEWRALSLSPREWAARLRGLCGLVKPPRPQDGQAHPAIETFRSAAEALKLFEGVLEEAATQQAETPAVLPDFWRAVKSVLRLTPLRLRDLRRNVVHVLGAHEARQWELPVVFVCGLVEKQFPRLHRQDPFFPDAARRELFRAGIRVRTAAEFEQDERFLFDVAVTRATVRTVLSYPKSDAAGQATLRSLYLDEFPQRAPAPPPVRPRPLYVRPAGRPAVALRSSAALETVASRTATFSPTALETFLGCPFHYFGDHLLRLQPPPVRPEERFDALVQGTIVHAVLAEWHRAPQPVAPLFERIFGEICAKKHIAPGYRTEWQRHRLLEDLRAFTDTASPSPDVEIRTEQEFRYDLAEGVTIRGRIDRLDIFADGRAAVIDYKYSGAKGTRDRVKNEDLLQAPLYVLAVERFFHLEPAAMHYCGLRGGVEVAGWEAPFDAAWLGAAAQRSLDAASRIRNGEIAPAPSEGQPCGWCGSQDVCRYQTEAGRAVGA